jgi:hypothetical protein
VVDIPFCPIMEVKFNQFHYQSNIYNENTMLPRKIESKFFRTAQIFEKNFHWKAKITKNKYIIL